ncbi:hypothetical protein ANO14919_142870 [Xylariales sp. No.14919]|nr:hypothetical protein ANO14919_142870 [Xylariales sp. No.14919]
MPPQPLQVYEGYRTLREFLVSDRQVAFKSGKLLTRVAFVPAVLRRMYLVISQRHAVSDSEVPRQKPATNSIPALVEFVRGVQGSEDAFRFWKSTLLGACVTEFPSLPEMASWGLVLSRYTGLNDVCFGIVRSGRMAAVPNIEGIMTPTIATVPMRLRTQSALEVSRYLEDVASFGNKVMPFEQYGLPLIRRLGADARMGL